MYYLQWEINTNDDGETFLSTRRSGISAIDKLIFGVLLPEPRPDAIDLIPTGAPNEFKWVTKFRSLPSPSNAFGSVTVSEAREDIGF